MKKLLTVFFSALLLCGIMMPAFAAEEVPDKPELVRAQVSLVPHEKRARYGSPTPASPEGIVLTLSYSDGTSADAKIIEKDGAYFANGESVVPEQTESVDSSYGEHGATLLVGERELPVRYSYYFVPGTEEHHLQSAVILYRPFSTIFVRGGYPNSLVGILLLLRYSDGHVQIARIDETYRAGNEIITEGYHSAGGQRGFQIDRFYVSYLIAIPYFYFSF